MCYLNIVVWLEQKNKEVNLLFGPFWCSLFSCYLSLSFEPVMLLLMKSSPFPSLFIFQILLASLPLIVHLLILMVFCCEPFELGFIFLFGTVLEEVYQPPGCSFLSFFQHSMNGQTSGRFYLLFLRAWQCTGWVYVINSSFMKWWQWRRLCWGQKWIGERVWVHDGNMVEDSDTPISDGDGVVGTELAGVEVEASVLGTNSSKSPSSSSLVFMLLILSFWWHATPGWGTWMSETSGKLLQLELLSIKLLNLSNMKVNW